MNHSQTIARHLLEIQAVILQPKDPFTWASGIKSPVYCDNRLTLSYPDIRSTIISGFVDLIKNHYPDVEVIAGTATAGIPHAALIAQEMNLPMVYVRSSAKSHGKKKQIEGLVKPGQKVVVIEDLISTGGSVLKAVDALKAADAEVLGVAAIFTYQLPKAEQQFKTAETQLNTLTNFEILIEEAVTQNVITNEQLVALKKWYQDPENQDWMLHG
ncbi:orotate phosphoribosyltransferase [Terrilactibacillus laevilacticus]|uniref:Orotate phosphoribosyltransferase n=1 Tax=Terrilactibacillus laevilacticus TaxID=1380157 RepID=A0ABW5PPY6_9BACI|nr:orotate phosphoribosyltransferase [Terrilactibacillus laevilacticus]